MKKVTITEYWGNFHGRTRDLFETENGILNEISPVESYIPINGIIVKQEIYTHSCGEYRVIINFIDGRENQIVHTFIDHYKRCPLETAKFKSLEDSLTDLQFVKSKTGLQVADRVTNATTKGFPNWYR